MKLRKLLLPLAVAGTMYYIYKKTEEYEFLNKYFYDGKYFNSWDEVIKYCEIQSDKEKLKRENTSKGVKNE